MTNGTALAESYLSWLIDGSVYMDKLNLSYKQYAQDTSM